MNYKKLTTQTKQADETPPKKQWEAPRVMDLNVEVIRQQEEVYNRMMDDPIFFQRIAASGESGAG